MDCDPNLKEDFFFSTVYSNNFSHKSKMGIEFNYPIKSACPSNNNIPLPFQDMQPHFGSQFTIGGSSSNPSFGIQNRSFNPSKPSSFEFFKESNPYHSGGVGSVPRANDEGLLYAFPIDENRIVGDGDLRHQNQTSSFKGFRDRLVNNTDNMSSYRTTENGRSPKTKQTVSSGINERRLEMRRASRTRSSAHAIKGKWTSEEDKMLIQLVNEHGVSNWPIVAEKMQTRVGKQCRERWYNHLRPDIKTSPWTEEEERILIQLHSQLGNKWSEMSKWLHGRTENAIKNHWNATKRRQRRTRSHQSSFQLKEYIQTVITTSADSSGAGADAGGASNDYYEDEAAPMDDDGGHGHGVVHGDDGSADKFADCYKVASPVVDAPYREMPSYGGGYGSSEAIVHYYGDDGGVGGGGSSSGNFFYEIPYDYTDCDMFAPKKF